MEKRYVLTKLYSSYHCFITFNVMQFDLYTVVFTFVTLSLLPLVLWWCSWMFKVKRSPKFSASFFHSWMYTNQQLTIIVIFLTLSIFDSLYIFLSPSLGPLKFRILIALFCIFSTDSMYSFCLWPHIWQPYLRCESKSA